MQYLSLCYQKSFQKKMRCNKEDFLKDLGFLIVKNQLPLQFVTNVWSKCLILHLCVRIVFPSKKNDLMKYCNLTTLLKSIMRCEVLGLDEVFQGTYFGHFFLGLSVCYNWWKGLQKP